MLVMTKCYTSVTALNTVTVRNYIHFLRASVTSSVTKCYTLNSLW